MNGQLENVATMIKKTFHTKSQVDCLDGCILYMEAHCDRVRETCQKNIELKFIAIDKKLTTILGIIGSNGGSN